MYSTQTRSQEESRESNAKGIAMVLLAVVAGAAVALWLVAWSTGWKPLGVTAWSVDQGSGLGKPKVNSATMPRPRLGLVETADNRGQVLFGRYCDSCHTGGKGSMAPSLRTASFKSRYKAEDVSSFIRAGGFVMPAYNAELVSDADLALIAKYVLSLPVEAGSAAAPAPASAVSSEAAAGAQVFAKNCGACHPDGNAGMGPSVRTAAVKAKPIEQMTEFLRTGSPKMPGFKADAISDSDLSALIKYMVALQ